MKRMKNLLGLVALGMMLMGGMSACSVNCTSDMKGDLKFSQNDLQPKNFDAIDVSVVSDVYYTQTNGSACSVRLDYSAIKDQNLVEELKKKVKVVYRDGGVEIGLSGRIGGVKDLGEGKRLKVYVSSPDLVKIDQEGVGSFHADAINSDRLEINNEGVGSVIVKQLLANKVKVDNEGVGSVIINQLQSDDVDVDNEGVGKVTIGNFKGGKLAIDNEGVGKVSAHVDCQRINASLDGVGGITLSGVTREYQKSKDGVGSFHDSDLKVVK